MVFGRRSKTTTNELNRYDLVKEVYREFLEGLDCDTKVYVPLWGRKGVVVDVIEQYVIVGGILPDNEWLDLHPWEIEIL